MNDNALVPYSDIQTMANDVVKGGLFPGIRTPEQALTLFLVAQAEGLHPMTAMRRYHIIQGQVSLRTDTMLANFMARGGTVEWKELTTRACEAVFTSPGLSKPLSYRWTMEDAQRAGLSGKDNWKKDPRSMLKARVISGGLRLADPASVVGLYAPEEVQDFDPVRKVADAEIVPPEPREDDIEALLLESIAMKKAQKFVDENWKGAGRSSREASGSPSPVAPKAPDADAPQPAPDSPTRAAGSKTMDAENKGDEFQGQPPDSTPEVAAEIVAEGGKPPEFCYCGDPIGLYFSTQERYMGRPYMQCRTAWQEVRDRLNEGRTAREAHAMVSTCYRAWAGKWPLGEPE